MDANLFQGLNHYVLYKGYCVSLAEYKVKSSLQAGWMCGSSLSPGVLEAGFLLGAGEGGTRLEGPDLCLWSVM